MQDDRKFVRVLVRDEAGLYLGLRDLQEKWHLPGGKVEKNSETILEASHRELLEETGLHLLKSNSLGDGQFVFNGERWQGYFTFASIIEGQEKVTEPHIFSAIRYLPLICFFPSMPENFVEQLIKADYFLKAANMFTISRDNRPSNH